MDAKEQAKITPGGGRAASLGNNCVLRIGGNTDHALRSGRDVDSQPSEMP
jgi:hypothetical protein